MERATEKKNDNVKKRIILALSLAGLCLLVAVIALVAANAGKTKVQDFSHYVEGRSEIYVSLETEKGEIILKLRADLMPATTGNFLKLVHEGFYDGLSFHRVEDTLIQAGDPNGDGTGGPGWTIKFESHPELTHKRAAISMARKRDDMDSAGSQFFIVKKTTTSYDGEYAVFGEVVKGMSVVDSIEKGDKIIKASETQKPE